MEEVDYKGHDIFLNVYDLSQKNDYFWRMGLGGIFHSGVEVAGTEYSFTSEIGGLGENGIFLSEPKSFHSYETPLRESRKMGVYNGRLSDVRDVIDNLRKRFNVETFHKLYNNSNTFCEIFLWDLIGVRAPLFLNRMPFIGGVLNCLLPIENIRKPLLELTGAEYTKKERRKNKIHNGIYNNNHEFKKLNNSNGRSHSFWGGKSDDKASKNNNNDSNSSNGTKPQRSLSFSDINDVFDTSLLTIDYHGGNNNESKKSDNEKESYTPGYRNLDRMNESKVLSMDLSLENIDVVACGCGSWGCFGSSNSKTNTKSMTT